MARTFRVSDLITKVRQRGDYLNSVKVTDAIVQDFLESAIAELHDLLVSKWEDYYTKRATFTLVVDQGEYDLTTIASDFYKLLGLDVQLSGTWTRVVRFDLHERNDFQEGYAVYGVVEGAPFRYRLEGDNLVLQPAPQSADSARLVYVHSAPKVNDTTDIIEGYNGWEELLVLLALRRVRRMLDEPVGDVLQEINEQRARIETLADARDAGEPARIQDVAFDDIYGGGWLG